MWRKIFFSLLAVCCWPAVSSLASVNSYEINNLHVTADVPETWKVVNMPAGGVQFLDQEQKVIVSVLARAGNGISLESIAQGFTEHFEFQEIKKPNKSKIILKTEMHSVPVEIILDGKEDNVVIVTIAGQKDQTAEKLVGSVKLN